MRDRWCGRHYLGTRIGGRDGIQTEIIIRIAVADVDGAQAFAAGADFFDYLLRLGTTELRIDQNRFVLTSDQYR